MRAAPGRKSARPTGTSPSSARSRRGPAPTAWRRVPADARVGGGRLTERARHPRPLRRAPGAGLLVGGGGVVEHVVHLRHLRLLIEGLVHALHLRRVPAADGLVEVGAVVERARHVAAQVLGVADGAGVEETAGAAVGVDRRRGRRLGPGAAGVIGELVGADAAAVGVPRGAAVGEQAPCRVSHRCCRYRSPQRPRRRRARPRRARPRLLR